MDIRVVKHAELTAVIIRADGTVEDLGVIAQSNLGQEEGV